MYKRQADKVLRAYGYEGVRQKGSHKQYLNKETGDLTTIKQESPLKKAYILYREKRSALRRVRHTIARTVGDDSLDEVRCV